MMPMMMPPLLPLMLLLLQNYGGLASTLRGALGMSPEISPDEYRQRSRVQVRCHSCTGQGLMQGAHDRAREHTPALRARARSLEWDKGQALARGQAAHGVTAAALHIHIGQAGCRIS